jgi:hypothetical protein
MPVGPDIPPAIDERRCGKRRLIEPQGAIVHASAPEALWKNEEIKTQYLGVPGRSG